MADSLLVLVLHETLHGTVMVSILVERERGSRGPPPSWGVISAAEASILQVVRIPAEPPKKPQSTDALRKACQT